VTAYLWAIGFWLSFAVMMAAEDRVRLSQRGLHTGFWTVVLVEGAWCLTFALLTPPIFYIVRRYPVTKQNRIRRAAAYIFGLVPFMVAFASIRWLILPTWSPVQQQFVPRSFHTLISISYAFADLTWTYLATVIAAHAYSYMERARKEETERLELQQALATSELQALKSQIHPHFLFNTLHGISTLIDSDGRKAKEMIVMLSNLLRTALKHGQADLVPLQEELNFLEDYLALEKIRLRERLDVRWDVAPDTRAQLIPQLLLQPMVENAIVHGIACCREGGWIQITSRKRERWLEIQIVNSMCGKQRQGMGVGLQNARSRLKYLYGEEAQFSFAIEQNQLAIASVTVPSFEASPEAIANAEMLHATAAEGPHARPDRG
jgi:sensor histidine kinase YesM